jgi:hypothetical protein
MRILILLVGALLAAPACAQTPAAPAAKAAPPGIADNDLESEVGRLRLSLAREVPGVIRDNRARAAQWIALAKAELTAQGDKIERPQLLVAVDRNPRVQQMRILLARPDAPWQDLGGTKVSTGQAHRVGYFITPRGVFRHTDVILDWRAEGTFNENHIRGLGLKGMRVWDFGWRKAWRGWGEVPERDDIVLLLHATDPDYLEPRLGHPASKGCVRIPAVMNRFLDRHGVLDREYEIAAEVDIRFRALLLPERTPTPLAGDRMVVVDSSEPPEPSIGQ